MERILKLRELINYYDHSYYNLSIPQIPDEQYDLLFRAKVIDFYLGKQIIF
jgi:NAD-dependent DNA ligase